MGDEKFGFETKVKVNSCIVLCSSLVQCENEQKQTQ